MGNEDSGAESRTVSLSEASAGAMSLICAVRLMAASSRTSPVQSCYADLPPKARFATRGGLIRPENTSGAGVSIKYENKC